MQEKTRSLVSTIFSLDNGFMRLSERIFDLMLVNLLFVLTSLPVLTLGVSKLSLFTVLHRLNQGEKISPVLTYLQAFKDNLREGIQLSLVEILPTGICLLNLFLIWNGQGPLISLVKVFSLGLLFLVWMTVLYLYPIASRYRMSLKDKLIKSLILAALHLPKTLLMGGVGLVLVLLSLQSNLLLLLVLSFLAIIGCSLLAYGNSFLVDKALVQSVKS